MKHSSFKSITKLFCITAFIFPFSALADWSGPDDGSGFWGPPFCDTRPANFSGICTAVPEEFSFTIAQFRLRNADDKSFVNLASAPGTFDFAATAGASLGDFVSGASVPAGTYDAYGFIAEGNAVIRGETTLDGGAGPRCRTDNSGSGVAQDTSPPENFTVSLNNTPLFDVIGAGTDEVDAIAEGPGIEIDFINPSGQMVFVGDSLAGTSFPIVVEEGQAITFDFSLRPVKGIVFEWDGAGNCTAAYTGDMQISIAANVE